MRKGLAVLVLSGLIAVCASGVAADKPAEAKAKADAPKVYATPQEVFDVYVEAANKSDIRTQFSCVTPERRDQLVRDTVNFAHLFWNYEQALDVLKKHRVDKATVESEYYKRYKQKYGVDLRKLEQEYEAKKKKIMDEYNAKQKTDKSARSKNDNPPSDRRDGSESCCQQIGPSPSQDSDLYWRAVIDNVNDPAAFVLEIRSLKAYQAQRNDVLKNGDPISNRWRNLRSIRIPDDAARGDFTLDVRLDSGDSEIKRAVALDSPIRFRKVNGSWLIDQLLP